MKNLRAVASIATIIVFTGALTAAKGHAADGTPPAPTSSTADAASDDAGLDPKIAKAMASVVTVSEDEPGFAGEWFDRETSTYTLYLVGDPTPRFASLAKKVEPDLTVKFEQAPATLRELEAAAAEAAKIDGVAGVFFPPDASGIVVDYVGDSLPSSAQARSAAGGVNVTWKLHDRAPVDLADTRPDDAAPFEGGSRVYVGNLGGCSIGLPVVRTSNANVGLLTAAHCSDWGQQGVAVRTQVNSRVVGTTRSLLSLGWDVHFLRDNTTYGPRVFTGGHNSGSKYTLMPEYRRNVAGDRVHVSGGYSGIQVGDIVGSYTPTYGPAGVAMGSFFVVQSIDSSAIAGNGDSGSPVFEYHGNYAHPSGILSGVFSAAPYNRTCEGIPGSTTRLCGSRAVVSKWCKIRSALGVRVLHGSGSYLTLPGPQC